MSDSRKIRVDALKASVAGITQGVLITLLTGEIGESEAKTAHAVLTTIVESIDDLVAVSAEQDLEEANAAR